MLFLVCGARSEQLEGEEARAWRIGARGSMDTTNCEVPEQQNERKKKGWKEGNRLGTVSQPVSQEGKEVRRKEEECSSSKILSGRPRSTQRPRPDANTEN